MNSISIKILASVDHPGVFWRVTFSSRAGRWHVALDGTTGAHYETLADVMHSANLPRAMRGALRDLLTASAIWDVRTDHSQRF